MKYLKVKRKDKAEYLTTQRYKVESIYPHCGIGTIDLQGMHNYIAVSFSCCNFNLFICPAIFQ